MQRPLCRDRSGPETEETETPGHCPDPGLPQDHRGPGHRHGAPRPGHGDGAGEEAEEAEEPPGEPGEASSELSSEAEVLFLLVSSQSVSHPSSEHYSPDLKQCDILHLYFIMNKSV